MLMCPNEQFVSVDLYCCCYIIIIVVILVVWWLMSCLVHLFTAPSPPEARPRPLSGVGPPSFLTQLWDFVVSQFFAQARSLPELPFPWLSTPSLCPTSCLLLCYTLPRHSKPMALPWVWPPLVFQDFRFSMMGFPTSELGKPIRLFTRV